MMVQQKIIFNYQLKMLILFFFVFLVPFEYEVVAIVDNEADINSAQDLRGSKFCHPGHGLENHWTDILANV